MDLHSSKRKSQELVHRICPPDGLKESYTFGMTNLPPSSLVAVEMKDQHGKISHVHFNRKKLSRLTTYPSFLGQLNSVFLFERRVRDVWRYTVTVDKTGVVFELVSPDRGDPLVASNYHDVLADWAIGLRVLLILLESPHVDEYAWTVDGLSPRAPAQGEEKGDAGGALAAYLTKMVARLALPKGKYAVVIANPVPYHCSLSWMAATRTTCGNWQPPKLNSVVRNHVWKTLWKQDWINKDFLARCAQYAPHTILNCCTSSCAKAVTRALLDSGFGTSLFTTSHPAYTWNRYFGIQKKNALPGHGPNVFRILPDGNKVLWPMPHVNSACG